MARCGSEEQRLRGGGPAVLAVGLVVALALTGCPKKDDPAPVAEADPVATAPPLPKEALGDAARGKELVGRFQCNRCHDGTGHEAAPQNKHCVQCHKDIIEDRFEAPAASKARWKPRVKDLTESPSLDALGERVSRAWLERFLLQPDDLRPHLAQSMPRLALTTADARDIAAFLAPPPEPANPHGPTASAGADLGRGRRLLETKGCGSCHVFTGVAPIAASAPPAMDGKEFARGHALAPDLRVVRERMSPAQLAAWLRDPKGVKPDTAMPRTDLSAIEVRDLSGYILRAELGPIPTKPKVERLPVLARRVTFKEVDEKVFHRTCWHCHSEPDYAIGNGGPGNSGGFGFRARGMNLSDYNGIAAGYLDDVGERASVFARDAEGVPRLVRALVARHDEERGAPTGAVRGMPLGYPALSLEEIQLVESWIAQGRPR
jgi:mono/diheme cytochrome c family protein